MSTSEITSQEFRVPVFLTGIVNKLEGIDFCMDGATHGLQTLLGLARLRPSNEEADGFLDHVSGTRLRVTVAGYPFGVQNADI
jgi:hypothetical protein